MADLENLSHGAALDCDRAIFTSLPSRTGEGYRLVAWSNGVRPEERQELTRRAPSHGSLAGDQTRAVFVFRLQSTGRCGWGFVRISGAEHTQRGGGRVWTELLLADAADAAREGLAPAALRAALASVEPPKPPVGGNPLPRVAVARPAVFDAPAGGAKGAALAAGVASLLVEGRACVIAAGKAPLELFEDAFSMIPASLRAGIEACAGLRFSMARGVKATLTDRIDQDTIRATRGQKVETIDLESRPPAVSGALAPWLSLMLRWRTEERGADAVELADRLAGGWTIDEINDVARLCESIDRRETHPAALGDRLARRSAA